MSLVPNWKVVLRRSWSVWLIGLAALLSGIEAALPFFPIDIPPGKFAVASILVSAAAFVARLIAQKELHIADMDKN